MWDHEMRIQNRFAGSMIHPGPLPTAADVPARAPPFRKGTPCVSCVLVFLASSPVVADEYLSSQEFVCESQDPTDDSQRKVIVNTSERTLTIVDTDGMTEVEPFIKYNVGSGLTVNRFGTERSGPMLYGVVTSHHKLSATSFYTSGNYLLSYEPGSVFNQRRALFDDCAPE
jgi:hypothetical protein